MIKSADNIDLISPYSAAYKIATLLKKQIDTKNKIQQTEIKETICDGKKERQIVIPNGPIEIYFPNKPKIATRLCKIIRDTVVIVFVTDKYHVMCTIHAGEYIELSVNRRKISNHLIPTDSRLDGTKINCMKCKFIGMIELEDETINAETLYK